MPSCFFLFSKQGTDEEEDMVRAKLKEFVLYFTDISVRESDFLEVSNKSCSMPETRASSLADRVSSIQESATLSRPPALSLLRLYLRPPAVRGAENRCQLSAGLHGT